MTDRPLHYRANHWIEAGIYDRLASFAEFERRVNDIPLEKDRGDIFEIFVEGYLATQPITQRVQHWVVGDIPLEMRKRFNLPSDGTGIDGIYEDRNGSFVAYQVKYRQNHRLGYGEVSPFLGITEEFGDRVIFTNATSLAKKAEVRTRWFGGSVLSALTPSDFNTIESWLKERPAAKLQAVPDPNYQTQVLADIKAALKDNARANVVMACGTGKTLVSLWAAEQAEPKTVLVLLPSLLLLQQTLSEWSQHSSWGDRFSYLCVCSDKKVGLKDDAINIDPSDVGFRVDTDPAAVRRFLEQPTGRIKIIFSTYQSSRVVAEGCTNLPPIDLAIFDEAHKTTGRAGKTFSYALDNDNIRISKRLFLTATPRHIDIRRLDKDGEFEVRSMDDEQIYGPRAHTLSFGAAASKGIICNYKLIISLIDKAMVDDFALKNGITLVEGDEIGANWVANLIALEQAVKKVGASKIITFHSRVSNAEAFANEDPRGVGHYLPDFDVGHVNGTQNTADRNSLIKNFADAPRGVITNARCLTEGVDIPAVDMVAFIEPRQSKVDIVQAVGRAMRKPRGSTTKTIGYVLVPLFAGADGSDFEEAIKSQKFDAIADVLNALREHDEDLVDIIRVLKEARGGGKSFNPKRLIEKLEIIGPEIQLESLVESISLQIVDRIGASWDAWFGKLKAYLLENDYPPQIENKNKRPKTGMTLADWCSAQRTFYNKGKLIPEKENRLNQLKGWSWDPVGQRMFVNAKAVRNWCNENNTWIVPDRGAFFKSINISAAAKSLKQSFRAGKLQKKAQEEIECIEGWTWGSQVEAVWNLKFEYYKKWHIANNAHMPPRDLWVNEIYGVPPFNLGSWINQQTARYASKPGVRSLSPDQIARFENEIRLWAWHPWERAFLAYKEAKSTMSEITTSFTNSAFPKEVQNVGRWLSKQRGNCKQNSFFTSKKLRPEFLYKLEKEGFCCDPFSILWHQGFLNLRKYVDVNGTSRVEQNFVSEDGFKLGIWVAKQRAIRFSDISSDRDFRYSLLSKFPDWNENWSNSRTVNYQSASDEFIKEMLELTRDKDDLNKAIKLAIYAGLSLNEVFLFDRKKLNSGSLIEVPKQRGKVNYRVVPISRSLIDTRPITNTTYNALSLSFSRNKPKKYSKEMHFQSLSMRFAKDLKNAGVPDTIIFMINNGAPPKEWTEDRLKILREGVNSINYAFLSD